MEGVDVVKKFITPKYTTGENVKKIRKQLGLTQKEFAEFVNTSVPTIERWETSEKEISGPIVLLLLLLKENVGLIDELMIPKKKYPLRMWYMHEESACTLIEVDENNRKVFVKNYTNKIMFRAFGKVEKPTFEQYEEWLESRCFPKERDKMKLMLREFDLPFYDPMMIVEKTEGRMAEDKFWIKIER